MLGNTSISWRSQTDQSVVFLARDAVQGTIVLRFSLHAISLWRSFCSVRLHIVRR